MSERPNETPVDPISEIIAYVMNTPGNTNPAILREMIEALTSQTTTSSSDMVISDGGKTGKD